MKRLRAAQLVGMLLSAVLIGCQDDFDPATLVKRPIILGATVSVIGDETRSTPSASETARVSLTLAGPRDSYQPDEISTMIVQCTYPDRFTGVPICQEFLDLAQLSAEELEAMLGLSSLDMEGLPPRLACEGSSIIGAAGVMLHCIEGSPAVEVLGDSVKPGRDILLRGVICTTGSATFDLSAPSLFSCAGGEEGAAHPFHTRVEVDGQAERQNHSPWLPPGALTINGRPFEFDRFGMATFPECTPEAVLDPTIPTLDPYNHRLGLRVPLDAREVLTDGGRERLELTVYATHGEVERRFTFFEDSDETAPGGAIEKQVEWIASDTTESGEGQWVDFWMTLRDSRGGLTTWRRSACITEPKPF